MNLITSYLTVTWFKGTKDLTYDFRHRTAVDGSEHSLQIREVTTLDAGEFIAKATNAMGEIETRCIVRVNRRSVQKGRLVH